MTKKYIITGTGTDVGKTFVTSCLIKTLLNKGMSASYWKWIQCGGDDVGFVESNINDMNLKILNPTLSLKTPCSPHLAGVLEERDLIKEHDGALPNCSSDYMFCEGAGGIMVPIDSDYMMIDWIKDSAVPVIIVSDSKLGGINHTLLTINALKQRNIEIAGVIYNNYDEENYIHIDNKKIVEKLGGVSTIAVVKPNLKEICIIENLNL